MLENLKTSLQKIFAKIRGAPYIDEKILDEILMDLVETLIASDVNVQLATEIEERVRQKVLETKVPEGIPLNNVVMRILYDELVKMLGEKTYKLTVRPGKTSIIMFVGLQGSGKTTTVAKLANYLKKRGYKVGIICADTYRPGAYEQLKQLAEKIDVPIYGNPKEKDPIRIVKEGLKHFKKKDVILVDTAGRHKEERKLIEEMKQLTRLLKPDEVILVIDGMIGQRAYEQAKAFAEATSIGSIIVTKLDGSARGGGALAAAAVTGAPIKFIGTGEKIDDIEPYIPQRFVARLLGIPDPEFFTRLLEEVPKSIVSGKFTLRDLLEYYENVASKRGFFDKIKDLIGIGGFSEKLVKQQMSRQLAILKSMTKEELEKPELLKNKERIERIARGSGTSTIEVRRLIQQYEKLRKMIRAFMRSRRVSKEIALSKLMSGEIDPSELKKLLKGAS